MATPSRIRQLISIASVAAASCGAILFSPTTAHAQRVYVYAGRPEPPPPPPPGPYYGGRPYYYREPPYAFQLGLDVEGVAPLNPPQAPAGLQPGTALGGGAGFKVRAGEQFRFPGLRLTPELGYAYDHLWASDDLGDNYDWSMNRFFAGARLGFGHVIVPVVYAHVGYGWRQLAPGWHDSLSGTNGGAAFDVGAAIDFRLVPHFGFGAHLEYAQIALPTDTPQWLAIGAHADLIF